MGCGRVFREVRADIWLVFLGRRSGAEVWREGGGWVGGRFLGNKVGGSGAVFRVAQGKDIFVARDLNL